MTPWSDLLPRDVAEAQAAYDLDYKAWRMRQLDIPATEIARKMEVCVARIHQRVARFVKRDISPVEKYLGGDLHKDIGVLRTMRARTYRAKLPTLDLRRISAAS